MRAETTCHCGRLLVKDDEAAMIAHEAPECEWFKKLIASFETEKYEHHTREELDRALDFYAAQSLS